ncbi:hypothetical protein GCM10025868_40520 [Angustibacter aerolatus]|uniref:Uncharacterized protein n=1 Tax=Angustibacter aerolatus TaxID=1162965 RepID=A0ABQ6JPN2_9ACTN|nr:hypothetical protein GCM10025868_40520 [Angustibacter aerolatus]
MWSPSSPCPPAARAASLLSREGEERLSSARDRVVDLGSTVADKAPQRLPRLSRLTLVPASEAPEPSSSAPVRGAGAPCAGLGGTGAPRADT